MRIADNDVMQPLKVEQGVQILNAVG
ncbi:hypothetical protein C5167_040918 [Papaver somniferum]|uniref:Uncharacterized protein n=1 Tax=Papaver somniferum TaxID=3469 RepID=A0A4Y7IIQ5_PAPSO|nr:hypothetical protein C5167_040918 [Papaver somniferum]